MKFLKILILLVLPVCCTASDQISKKPVQLQHVDISRCSAALQKKYDRRAQIEKQQKKSEPIKLLSPDELQQEMERRVERPRQCPPRLTDSAIRILKLVDEGPRLIPRRSFFEDSDFDIFREDEIVMYGIDGMQTEVEEHEHLIRVQEERAKRIEKFWKDYFF